MQERPKSLPPQQELQTSEEVGGPSQPMALGEVIMRSKNNESNLQGITRPVSQKYSHNVRIRPKLA